MLYAAFGAILGAALLAEEEEYGYGESSNLWNKGGFGLRGAPRNWRDSDPRFGSSSQGMRGPTASFRYPLPRPWERAPVGWKTAVPVETGRYGEMVFEERNIVSVSPGDYGLAHEKAAAMFALFARDNVGRTIMRSSYADAGAIWPDGYNRVKVVLTGAPITEMERGYLRYLKTRFPDLEMEPRPRTLPGDMIEVVFDL